VTPREQAIAGYERLLHDAALIGLQHEVERELAKTDLFYLLVVVLGRRDVNHDWLFARCREVQTAPNGYLDLWFREAGKSSLITLGLTIQDILNDPEITVGIISFNRPSAKKFLGQIKREFEANDRLRALFPDILWGKPSAEAPVWSMDEGIIVKRKGNPKEATIEAYGLVDSQPVSKHFQLLVYDDVVTRESVTNPDTIEKVTNAWAESRALRTDGGVTRYIGTRWHHNDTYREILRRGSAIERRYPATDDGTEHGKPVLKSQEWLDEQRRDMGPYVFAAQLLLNPTAGHAQGFKDEWLRYHQQDGEGANLNKYILGDAASEKKRNSDYTALGVVGLGADNNYYVLDLVRDRLSLTERGDALFALHRRWKPQGVGYESYGLMADVEYFNDRMRRENYHFEITKVGGQMPKPDRIKRLVPVCEQGRFYLLETCGKVDYEGKWVDLVQSFLNDEYRAFPVPAHDDMLDMLSRIFDIETVWPKPVVELSDRYARRRPARSGRSWMAA
jgi:phage terminase large subunit-like protein